MEGNPFKKEESNSQTAPGISKAARDQPEPSMGKAGVGQDSSALTSANPNAAAGFFAHVGRPAILLGGLAAITLFQFFVFPGHSWLAAQTDVPDTKVYVPMIERLGSPGL